MAGAFYRAGFECIDVHMTDILSGRVSLSDFRGLAACGGFSYGDVLGAGGLSNAMPELVNDAGKGGRFDLREVHNDEPGMSPLEIWCNESQERYVMAIPSDRIDAFVAICDRERCPYAMISGTSSPCTSVSRTSRPP